MGSLAKAEALALLAAAEEATLLAVNDEDALLLASTLTAEARRIKASRWEPYPWQHPHRHPPHWMSERAPGVCDERCLDLPVAPIPTQGMWLELGGRGTGKTEGAAHYVDTHAEGPACDTRLPGGHRIVIVAPTQGDAVEACVTGVSGLQTINPSITLTTTREGTVARWPGGSRARLLGAHGPQDIDRLRAAGNTCLVWLEEAAAMRRLDEVLHHTTFGLRIGTNPHYVGSTTPKNRKAIIDLMGDAGTVQTRGRTRDAHRLDDDSRRTWEDKYGGTTLGRQELDGEVLGDVEGALWVHDRPLLIDGLPNPDERPGIENDRVSLGEYGWTPNPRPRGMATDDGLPMLVPVAPEGLTLMQRVIVAVDPPGGRTECGIVVVGSIGNHVYPLADLSLAGPPGTWAMVVIGAFFDYGAEGIAAEHTYGGDMVADVLSTRMDALGVSIPIFKVPTKVGKRLRAEPVQALYQQHRAHHVGVLPGVEGEQTAWVPGEGESPNRLDALVHGVTYLALRARPGKVSNPAQQPRRIGGQRGMPTAPRQQQRRRP